MEQPYGQQPPPVVPPASPPPVPPVPPAYSIAQPAYTVPPPRHSMIGRMLRLLSMRFFSGLARLGRALRPHWLMTIIVVLLLSVIAVETFMLALPALGRMASAQSTQRAESIPPAPAVESYIQGQQDFNGALMWESFSEGLQSQLRDEGGSRVSLENQIKKERDIGQRYVKFDYIGGVDGGDGSSTFFYLAEIESPNPQQNGRVSYIFTVDPQGKIAGIKMGSTLR